MTFQNCSLAPPNASNPSNASKTSQRLRESFMTFRNCCLAPPNASRPSKPSQRLRDCCSASESFRTFRSSPQRVFLAPPNASNPSKTSRCLRDCCSASESLLCLSETAVWHPQTLPTLPKPRSASETAAAPPRVFYDLPKLLFGTPKRFQPFQPFQNLAAPQRLLQRLRESFMTFRNCCFRHPQTLPTLPKPRSASETVAVFRESFMTKAPPALPQRLLRKASHTDSLHFPERLSSYRNHKKGVGGTRALAHSIIFYSNPKKRIR